MRVAMPLINAASENKSTVKEAIKNRAIEAINPVNLTDNALRKRKSNTSVTQRKRKVKRTANTIGKRASRTTGKLVAPSL